MSWDRKTNLSPIADVLLIQNGGVLTSGYSRFGFFLGGTSSNSVLITDPGSTLILPNVPLSIGFNGAGNSLVISNGGKMVTTGFMGYTEADGPNSILITGPGSVWSNNAQAARIGAFGAGSTLAIRNSGLMVNNFTPNIFSIGGLGGIRHKAATALFLSLTWVLS